MLIELVERFNHLLAIKHIVNIPVHVDPSPVNPGLQTQMKEPSRLVQLAFLSHGWDSLEHSLISDMSQKDKIKAWINILSEQIRNNFR